METLREIVETLALRHEGAPAVTLSDASLSYRELDELGDRSAALLRSLGCQEGDVVMARCRNSLAMLATWLGCAKLGAVFMPVNALLTGAPLRTVVAHAGGSVMVADADLAGDVTALQGELPALRHLLVAGGTAGGNWLDFDALLASASAERQPPLTGGALAPAKLMYTSGTTGSPKGVVWSRRAEALHAICYGDELVAIDPGENTYACLPLFHATCQGTLVGTLWRGGHITVDHAFDPFRFWSRVRAAEAVFFPYVGTILTVLASRPPRSDDADNPVRRVMGSAAPAGLWRVIEDRFQLRIEDVWGQTETASCWTRPAGGSQRPGTVGRPTDRFEARIATPDGDEPLRGTPGELWMRPLLPHIMFERYHRDDGATAGMWTGDGWYRTGDRMLQDAEGDFVFEGRLRDAIRRRGEMIAPLEVEQAALLYPEVAEAAAVGVPAPHGVEEEIKLCVVAREGVDLDCGALSRQLRDRLPSFMVPRYIQVYDAFPKTPTTRIQKYRLRDDGVSAAWDSNSAARSRP